MLVNFDCSAMWLKDPTYMINAFNMDPLYLRSDIQGSPPDYRVNVVHFFFYKSRKFVTECCFLHSALANPIGKKIQSIEALVRVEDLWRGESSTIHQKPRRTGSWIWGVGSIGSTIWNRGGGRFRTRLFPIEGTDLLFIFISKKRKGKKKERKDRRCHVTKWMKFAGIERLKRDVIEENQQRRKYSFGSVQDKRYVLSTVRNLFAVQREQRHPELLERDKA